MKMESVVEREDPSVDVVTLETPNLSAMLGTNSATLPGKLIFVKVLAFIYFLVSSAKTCDGEINFYVSVGCQLQNR